jgi:F420-dependent oxidoreductase-like protein
MAPGRAPKLGLQLGYWGAGPPQGALALAQEAERLGFDSVWAGEAWGSDVFTPLAWIGAHTSKIRLCSGIAQLSARTPTATAMHALTLDHLSGGRFALGLGVSGPQVVEGWYGRPFGKPLERTREYVSIVRQVLKREQPVRNDGPHYPLPYRGPGSWDLGKPLRSITHPLRADVPIFLGAEGPKNVALAAEIADGWIPVFFSPRRMPMFRRWLDEGFARGGRSAARFDVMPSVQVVMGDDVAACRASVKARAALYVGGMGARGKNFYNELAQRYGYEGPAKTIQDLYLSGRKQEAEAAVPDELVDEVALCGPRERIRERLAEWKAAGVTTLMVGSGDLNTLRTMAELAL